MRRTDKASPTNNVYNSPASTADVAGNDGLQLDREYEKIYRSLATDFRSKVGQDSDGHICKCLVRFHNCTPYRVTPFWIDFRGLPIQYPTLARGTSLNIDTYVSHMWFFKTHDHLNKTVGGAIPLGALPSFQSDRHLKVLAVPEESINEAQVLQSSHDPLTTPLTTRDKIVSLAHNNVVASAVHGNNNVLICSLCKHVLKTNHRAKPRVPCPHFTGEAKFSTTDLNCRRESSYIYSCPEDAHRREHAKKRRNIYLVEPFFNLRERCFLTLMERIRQNRDIVSLDLPTSLIREYLQFVTTLKKLDENNKND